MMGPEHYEFVMKIPTQPRRVVPLFNHGIGWSGATKETHMKEAKVREGSILAVVMDEANQSIVFNVRGAAPDGGGKSITLNLAAVHPSNVAYAALHGFKQRIGDMAALSRNPDTGLAASPADKFDAIARGIEHYMSGTADWNLRAASGERTSGELGLLARAIAELKSRDVTEVRDWLKTKTEAERKGLAVAAAVKPIMDRMREEAAAPIDAEEMLGELA
jgi:hypothetical protein